MVRITIHTLVRDNEFKYSICVYNRDKDVKGVIRILNQLHI